MSYSGPRTRGWTKRSSGEAGSSDGVQARPSNGGANMNGGGLTDLLEASQSLERSNEMKMKQIQALIEELRETARNYKDQRDASTAAYCMLMAQHSALEERCKNLESIALLGGGGGAPHPWDRRPGPPPRPASGGIDALLEASQAVEQFNPMVEMGDAARGQGEPWGGPQAQAGFNAMSGDQFALERLQFAAYNELMSKHSAPERNAKIPEGMPKSQGEEVPKSGAHEAGESTGALQEAKASLERSNQAKEKRIQSLELELEEAASRHKKQLDASTAAYCALLSKHSALEGDFRNLGSVAKLRSEEVASLKKDAREVEANASSLQAMKLSLEASKGAAEKQVEALKEELQKAAREHESELDSSKAAYEELLDVAKLRDEEVKKSQKVANERQQQLDASKAAHGELESKHTALVAACKESESKLSSLDDRCKNLAQVAKLRGEEVLQLKKDAHTSKANNAAWQERSKERNKTLELSNQAKEKQIATLKMQLEAAAKEIKASKAMHEQDMSKWQQKIDQVSKQNEELLSLNKKAQSAKESIDALELRHKQSLESCTQAKEKQIRALKDESAEATRQHKVELESSKAVCRDLEAKLAAVEDERKKLADAAKREDEESSKKDSQAAKEAMNSLTLSKDRLNQMSQAKEQQILTLKETARVRKEQLDASKAAHDKLEKKHLALEHTCKNLISTAKLNHDEVQSLKKESQATKKTVDSLKETNITLLQQNEENEKQIHTLKSQEKDAQVTQKSMDSLKEANISLAQSIQEKEKQIGTLKEELQKTACGQGEQPGLSQSVYEETVAKNSALEYQCKNLVTTAKLNHEEVQALKKDAKVTQQTISSLKETNISLTQCNQEKQEQIDALKEELEKVVRRGKEQLEISRSIHEEMVTKNSALEDKCKNLESAASLKSAEVASLKKELQSLSLNQSLETITQAKEKKISTLKDDLGEAAHRHKVQLDSSKAECRRLEAKLADLEDKCKNPAKAVKHEDMESLKKEVQEAKETIESLTGSKEYLERSNQELKRALKEAARAHKIELDASRVACEELAAKHSSLEIMCKNLVNTAKLNHEDVQSMKKEVEITKKNITMLEATKLSLEQSNQMQEKRIRTLIDELDNATSGRDEHAAKPKAEDVTSLEKDAERVKSLEETKQSLEQSNQAKEKQIQTLKEELVTALGYKAQQVSSKAAYEELELRHSALEVKCKNLECTAKLKIEEVQSLNEVAQRSKIENSFFMQRLKDENKSLKQSCDEQMNALQTESKERINNYEKNIASLEVEIEQLKGNEKSLLNQIGDTAKTKESLQSEINRLLLKISTLEKDRKDVTSQLENKIEKLTADMQMQTKINESLHSQINEGLKCRDEMQGKITFLEQKLHRIQACSETNGSTETSKKKNQSPEVAPPGDEVVKELLSKGSEDRKIGGTVAATAMQKDNTLPCLASVAVPLSVTSQLKAGGLPTADNSATTLTATTSEQKVVNDAKKPSASANTETEKEGNNLSSLLPDGGGDICSHNENNHQNQGSHGNSSTGWHMVNEYEFQSEHFDTKRTGDSSNKKQYLLSQVTLGNILSPGERPGRSRRKRKNPEAPQKQPAEPTVMAKARKSMTRDSGEASSPGAAKSLSTKPGIVKVGDLGYKFKRFFHEFNQWYDGEVIEILSNGNRRCQYNDGSVEDYRVDFMRRKCRSRS